MNDAALEAVWEALMTAHVLIDDLQDDESAGLKKGTIKSMLKENKKAFHLINAANPDLPSPH
jgi:hypothetical protein